MVRCCRLNFLYRVKLFQGKLKNVKSIKTDQIKRFHLNEFMINIILKEIIEPLHKYI